MALDLQHNRVIRGEHNEPIKRWAVWFKTPFGYVESMDELQKIFDNSDINMDLAAFPVPVAITEHTHEVYER